MDQNCMSDPAVLDQPLSATKNNTVRSITSKVCISASGLLGDLLAQRSLYDEVSTLASISEGANKASSTPALANTSSPAPSSQNDSSLSTFAHNNEHKMALPTNWDPFRLQQQGNTIDEDSLNADFEAFTSNSKAHCSLDQGLQSFEDHIDPSDQQLGSCPVKEGKRRAASLHGYRSKQIVEESFKSPSNEADGAAVVALLSQPDFSLSQMPDKVEWNEGNYLHDDKRNMPQANLLPNMYTYPFVPSNTLSLLPNFKVIRKPTEQEQALHDNAEAYFRILSPGLISKDKEVLPWVNILNSYQDQVWGSIGLLTQESHPKVKITEEISEENLPKGSTLMRLAMILRHIGHSNNQLLAFPPI